MRISRVVGTVLQGPERQILGAYVFAEVAFGLENLGLLRKETRQRVDETLHHLGIFHLCDQEISIILVKHRVEDMLRLQSPSFDTQSEWVQVFGLSKSVNNHLKRRLRWSIAIVGAVAIELAVWEYLRSHFVSTTIILLLSVLIFREDYQGILGSFLASLSVGLWRSGQIMGGVVTLSIGLFLVVAEISSLVATRPPGAQEAWTEYVRTTTHLRPTQGLAWRAILGALTYGALSFASNMIALPATGNVALRPAVCIPMFFGVVFGPWVGLISGLVGNIIGDALSGWGFWFWWDIGNGLMGMIAGFAAQMITSYRDTKSLVIADVFVIIGVVVGMGFSSLSEIFTSGIDFATAFGGYFVPAALTGIINGIILVPILMVAYDAIASRSGR